MEASERRAASRIARPLHVNTHAAWIQTAASQGCEKAISEFRPFLARRRAAAALLKQRA